MLRAWVELDVDPLEETDAEAFLAAEQLGHALAVVAIAAARASLGPRRRRELDLQPGCLDRLEQSVEDAQGALQRGIGVRLGVEHASQRRRLPLRAESVASSRIEGLEIGARRLLHADAERKLGEPARDVTAAEVLGNIDAMLFAVASVGEGDRLSVDLLLEIHRRLLLGTRLEAHGGQLRGEQNWIGGSSFDPCSAEYVPPPPDAVPGLVADLCDFCNDESLPAIAQAAIAPAQFETIHPFVDGNGRVGRALIHLVLRRRRVVSRVLPPVSLILATWAQEYVDALTGTRYRGAVSSRAAQEGLNRWVGLFATAAKLAAADAETPSRHRR